MSVSVHIVGIRDKDGKLGDMVALKEQCDKLDIEYPKELKDYFNGTDALYMKSREDSIKEATEVSLEHDLEIDGLLKGDVEYGDGVILDLSKLPDDIRKIRIYMS